MININSTKDFSIINTSKRRFYAIRRLYSFNNNSNKSTSFVNLVNLANLARISNSLTLKYLYLDLAFNYKKRTYQLIY